MIFNMKEIRLGDLSEQETYDLLKEHKVIPVMYKDAYSTTYGIIKQLTVDDFRHDRQYDARSLNTRICFFSNNSRWDGGWFFSIKASSFEGYDVAWMFTPGEFEDMILFQTQTLYDLIKE